MRYLSLFLTYFSLSAALIGRGETTDRAFIEAAARSAAQDHKILVIEFWAPECSPCMRLKWDIFENAKNRDFLDMNFSVLKLSPVDSMYDRLWKFFHLAYQSTIIFLDADGNEIERTVSYSVGERELYIDILKNVAERKNLYADVAERYRTDSMNVTNMYRLANKLWSRYEIDDAVRLYNKVLLHDTEDKNGYRAECLYRIAEDCFVKTKETQGLWKFVTTFDKNFFTPMAYMYLIVAVRDQKDTARCLLTCREAYAKFPGNSDIMNRYAWMIYTFRLEKQYPRALELIQGAIGINPTYANYYDTQAWIYYGLGEKEKAIQSMKKAYELRPLQAYTDFIKKVSAE